MANGRALDEPAVYRIAVQGTLDARWVEWLEGFVIDAQTDDGTTIVGSVADQSALYGVLLKVHTLGLLLLRVERVGPYSQGGFPYPPSGAQETNRRRNDEKKRGRSDEMHHF